MKAKELWDTLKDKPIDVFALTGQKVSDYFSHLDLDGKKLYLDCKATAAIPALEAVLGNTYKCYQVEKYVVVEPV